MYKPQIKDKHSLVDLATYGSKSRRKIHSEVLIGEHPYPPIFKEGDILDANATFNLIQDTYDQEKINDALSKFVDKHEAEFHELEERVYKNQEIMNEALEEMGEKIDDALETVAECEEKVDQLDEKVDRLEEKHEQDIATVEEHITEAKNQVIEYYSIPNRYVYDGPEENLFVIR